MQSDGVLASSPSGNLNCASYNLPSMNKRPTITLKQRRWAVKHASEGYVADAMKPWTASCQLIKLRTTGRVVQGKKLLRQAILIMVVIGASNTPFHYTILCPHKKLEKMLQAIHKTNVKTERQRQASQVCCNLERWWCGHEVVRKVVWCIYLPITVNI